MKKIWVLISIIMLIISAYIVVDTYAKYLTGATATTNKYAGAWVIEVNDTDISYSDANTTFTIDALTYPDSEYVVENKIAPSSSGYFEIIVDPTGSSVAVRVDVSLDVDEMDISDAIGFTGACRVVNGQEVSGGLTLTGTNTYSAIISLSDVQNEIPATFRFYVGWDEEETEEGDEADTQLGSIKDVSTSLPVTVVVTQYSGASLN